MARIQTIIELVDRMSAPLRNVTNNLRNVSSSVNNIDNNVDINVNHNLNSVENALNDVQESVQRTANIVNDDLGNSVNTTRGRLERLANSNFGRLQGNIQKSSSLMDNFGKKILATISAFASLQGMSKVIEISDNLTQTVARLDLINDGYQTTEELQQMIFESAKRSRGSFMNTANAVAKIGQNAKDVFKTNEETIQFAETLNKMFVIAGSSVMEVESATLQLTQALGAGMLRGEELNAVFEASPNIIHLIAESLDVSIAKFREMASDGEITADIIKNALLDASVEIDKTFQNMPLTFSQIWQSFKNNALMAFEPVLLKLRELANSETFSIFVDNVSNSLYGVSDMIVNVFDLISTWGGYILQVWGSIAPVLTFIIGLMGTYKGILIATNVIEGIAKGLKIAHVTASYLLAFAKGKVAAANVVETATQLGLNTAMLAFPGTWIVALIMIIILAVYLLVSAWINLSGETYSAVGIMTGLISAFGAFIYNFVVAIVEFILAYVELLINNFIDFANFIGNVFVNPISSVIKMFADMFENILSFLGGIAKALDVIFNTDLSGAIDGLKAKVTAKAGDLIAKFAPDEEYKTILNKVDLNAKDTLGLERKNYGDSAAKGYDFGSKFDLSNFSNMFEMPNMDDFGGMGESPQMPDIPSMEDFGGFGGVDVPTSDMPNSVYDGGGGSIGNDLSNIANNTSDMADSLNVSNDELKYIRDMSSRDAVNKFTTAEVKVDLGGVTNNVKNGVDLDGMVDYLATKLSDTLQVTADGVY